MIMKLRDFKILGVPTTGWKSLMAEKVSPEKQVAAAGTPVTCPRCKDEIGRLSIPVFSGMQIPAAAVDFHPHQRRVGGRSDGTSKAECRKCGAAYMKHRPTGRSFQTVIHTALGWV